MSKFVSSYPSLYVHILTPSSTQFHCAFMVYPYIFWNPLKWISKIQAPLPASWVFTASFIVWLFQKVLEQKLDIGTGGFEKVERKTNVSADLDVSTSAWMFLSHSFLPNTFLHTLEFFEILALVRATKIETSSVLFPGVWLNKSSHHFYKIQFRLRLELE